MPEYVKIMANNANSIPKIIHQVGAGAYLIENFHILSHGNNDFDDKVRGLAHLEIKTSSK